MPDIETQPRAPRPPPPRSIKALVIPALAMLGAMTWYVAIRVAENELVTQKEARSIQLASKLLSKRRELDSQRLEKECAILAYDTRLGTMLKSDPEPMLIEQFSRSIAKLLPGQDVAILSPDGALIAASRRGIDATTIRSSSVVDRAKAVKPPEDIANLSRSGLWVMRGEERRVLEVAVSSIHLGEPIGMIALTTSLD